MLVRPTLISERFDFASPKTVGIPSCNKKSLFLCIFAFLSFSNSLNSQFVLEAAAAAAEVLLAL